MNKESQRALPLGISLVRTFTTEQDTIMSIAFDPQGKILASGSEKGDLKLWDVQNGELYTCTNGHDGSVFSIVFDPQGVMLATGSEDKTVKLWDVQKRKLVWLRTLGDHFGGVASIAFDPQGKILASGSSDRMVKVWDIPEGNLRDTFKGHDNWVACVAFDPQGIILASVSDDRTIKLWNVPEGNLRDTLKGHQNAVVSVAFDPLGKTLATGSLDYTVKLWDVSSGNLLHSLEGHTAYVDIVAFSPDGRFLASKSRDHTIRLWNCERWETVAVIPERTRSAWWIPALAFHPKLPLLASSGSEPGASGDERCGNIHFYELNYEELLGKSDGKEVHCMTGKIVLLGDHSVGKSALGHYLIHKTFKAQVATHGQQFWVFPDLGDRLADGTECEAILWDFAGQPDYRLVHALFVDNADLALVLFDSSNLSDPLHGVEFWLKQLQMEQSRCPIILVAAQTDRGSCSLTHEELIAFCHNYGIVGPITTSALTGKGIDELVECMKSLICWDKKPRILTNTTFRRIKDYILALKEKNFSGQIIVALDVLRNRLEAVDADWCFTDADMMTAVVNLENYGYVKRLRTSMGDQLILLQPERLNNLASSFVLEARRNVKGLGALEEKRLLSGGYDFPELRDLHDGERDGMLDSAALLFLEHNVCFRETDPLRMEPYLVFPELINLKKPSGEEAATEDGIAYTVSGPMENVFASLVVLLGYTHTFTRTNQWQDNARYEVGNGLVCGFRQESGRDGELDFVLSFASQVGQPVRTLFQGLFESFLSRRNLKVLRHEPVRCCNFECGELLDRSVVLACV